MTNGHVKRLATFQKKVISCKEERGKILMQHFDIEIKVFKNLMNGPVNLKLVIIGNN